MTNITVRNSEVMRPAILCENPLSISETFVRRHIENLNLGDTIVFGEVPLDSTYEGSLLNIYKPLLTNQKQLRRAIRLFHRLGFPDNFLKQIWAFSLNEKNPNHQSSYFLFEFGYILVRHYDFALFGPKPYFVYFRGQDASSLLKQPGYVKTLSRVLPRASGVVFVSNSLRQNLLKAGVTIPKSIVIPSGVETQQFVPGVKQPKAALSVGRFVEKKAHDDSLRALRLIVDRIHDFHLTLIGDGPLLETTVKQAKQLDLGPNVSFLGALQRPDVLKHMVTAKYYIQSSKTAANGDTEGFPSAIQEALSSGCVVCSTAHSGASDVLVHGRTALLCREGDFQGMADNIISLESDPSSAFKIARCARNFAETELDAEVCIDRFEKFVDDCLRGKEN